MSKCIKNATSRGKLKGHAWKKYVEKEQIDKDRTVFHTGRKCEKCGLMEMHN
jgi:hypothetical protein